MHCYYFYHLKKRFQGKMVLFLIRRTTVETVWMNIGIESICTAKANMSLSHYIFLRKSEDYQTENLTIRVLVRAKLETKKARGVPGF